jgi:hypothetical protein
VVAEQRQRWELCQGSAERHRLDVRQGRVQIRDAVVVLKTAKLESDRLTFDVDVLEGEPAGGDGPAALFIDRFG